MAFSQTPIRDFAVGLNNAPFLAGHSSTAQWFEGKLDASFYYRERNDEAFAEKAMELVRNKEKEQDA